MYTVVYLPTAKQDMVQTAQYIRTVLKNPQAALKQVERIVHSIDELGTFPYSCPMYYPRRRLEHDYRKLLVNNYMVFYWVEEREKTVTVARILYAKRSFEHLLTGLDS